MDSRVAHTLSRDDVISILTRFFIEKSRSSDLIISGSDRPKTEVKSTWAKGVVKRTAVHEEDFLVFRHFQDPSSTVLDVGAHFGYSAASIWASGAATAVISFEPIQGYQGILEEIKRLRKGRFDYVMTALGNRSGSITLTTPVVNGRAADALTTALAVPYIEGLARNIFRAAQIGGRDDVTSLKLYQFTAPLTTLDEALAMRAYGASTKTIAAIKIDTEGFEAQVISGSCKTLTAHMPMVMLEGGCRKPAINNLLLPLGYVPAARNNEFLQLADDPPITVNGFYVHRTKIDSYKSIGLLR